VNYTGDISVEEAWAGLTQDSKAVLVDVRTQAEWAFVGTCDLSTLNKSPLLVSWLEFPHMGVNPNFSQMIVSHTIEGNHIQKDWPIYFLCRSGVRSQSAAAEMVTSGFEQCFNIQHGFEGDRDHDGHRGVINGWKVAGLPWIQG